MAGHKVQRGPNTWRLHAYVGVDSKGKRRYATKTVHGTKREADRALRAFVTETERDRNATAAAEPKSVSQVLNKWLESKESRLSPVTASRYRVAFKHIEPALGSMPVSRVRPHHIEDLYASLHAKGQSGASIRKAHWALRQSLAWAYRHGYTALVATDGVELPPLGERKIDPPTSENVRRVIEQLLATKPDWGTLVAVLAWTGCRRGEACGLHWEDVDLHGGSILIRRAIITVSGGPIERGTKTGELRKIAIGPRTVELLREHWERCVARADMVGAAVEQSAYVFSPDVACRRPYYPQSITRAVATACGEAGVPHMRVHDLRHYSATTLLKNGSSVGEVMDRHGWSTVQMINRYRHLLDAQDVEAATMLENA
jgi:integrase